VFRFYFSVETIYSGSRWFLSEAPCHLYHVVTWLLEHCPLHGNASVNKRAVARRQLASSSAWQSWLNQGTILAFAGRDWWKLGQISVRIAGVPSVSTLIEHYQYINLLGFPLIIIILPLLHTHIISPWGSWHSWPDSTLSRAQWFSFWASSLTWHLTGYRVWKLVFLLGNFCCHKYKIIYQVWF
jgi:hypothetical protein